MEKTVSLKWSSHVYPIPSAGSVYDDLVLFLHAFTPLITFGLFCNSFRFACFVNSSLRFLIPNLHPICTCSCLFTPLTEGRSARDLTQAATSQKKGPGEDATSEQRLTEQWNEAEATYGICRPGVDDGAVYLHRQTTERVATGPEEWELIPVGHNMPPAAILEDIARVYRDIGDQWSALTWWLYRIHESSVLSAMPILGYANYVLVLENEYVNLGRRPHGLTFAWLCLALDRHWNFVGRYFFLAELFHAFDLN